MEILKALYRQADILILDEPTGVLTPAEADHLFRILKGLQEQGKTIILITHKLREIMEMTDNVSVMRRGTMVGTVKTAETSPEELAELMVGRKVLLEVEKTPANPGEVVLEVRGPAGARRGRGRAAEGRQLRHPRGRDPRHRRGGGQRPVGTAGGAGRHPDGDRADRAERRRTCRCRGMHANGQARREAGIAHVPEDRQALGLIMDFTRLGERGLRLSQRRRNTRRTRC